MKKRIVILLMGMALVLSTLTGCKRMVSFVQEKVLGIEMLDKAENEADGAGSSEEDAGRNDSSVQKEEADAGNANIEDLFQEGTPWKPQEGEGESEDLYTEPEETLISHGEEHYKMCMERFNSSAPDLTARVGEFLTDGEEGEIIEDKNGNYYGYEADYTSLCSVWCAVNDYEESAYATSVLEPQGKNTYYASNIISHDRNNAWVEGAAGDGIGESVTITKRYGREGDYGDWDCFFFTDLCIVNGMAKSEDLWKKNNRVKTLKMYFNEEYVCDLELEDTMKPQYISLQGLNLSAGNGEDSAFRFEIADVYKGKKYDDTVITGIELEFYTENH